MTSPAPANAALAAEYVRQRGLVQRALEAFKKDPDLEFLEETDFTGDFLYVQKRNQFWFRFLTVWATDMPMHVNRTKGWAHVFPELAEFDRMTGSPDHEDGYGFRSVETVEEAFTGEFE